MDHITTIRTLIARHEELDRLMHLIDNIAIIEYDGDNVEGSLEICNYLLDNGLSQNVVKRIILCGKKSSKRQDNITILHSRFPEVNLECTNRIWYYTDFDSLDVCATLVLHITDNNVTSGEFDSSLRHGKRLQEIVKQTRQAYYTCIFYEAFHYTMREQLRLTGCANVTIKGTAPKTDFCKERQKYIQMCEATLVPKDYFFQCVDEANNGCEDCNQCSKYGRRKMCPYAQKKVAGLYREGIYVPKDKRIAYQWELMAARQGYRDAFIQLADDMLTGNGCEQSVDKAMEIYRKYADNGDAYCISQIIRLADEGNDSLRLQAIPYVVYLAENGDEDMVLKLSHAFMHGDYGLPKDSVQQEEWIVQGAENGNPRFVKAMCELNEAKEDWKQAYRWYKRLAETSPDSVSQSDLERIELKMLTYGLTDYEVAEKGMNYLFGYHSVDRDTHLAFRCLGYAKEKGIMLAYGLLGQMYCRGIGVSKNKIVGRVLLREAVRNHDILSMEILIYNIEEISTDDMEDTEIIDAIENEIKNDNPYAFYLKGKCLKDGRIYQQSDPDAFELMQRAAGMAYPPAQYQLAVLYRDGIGTDQNSYLYRHWLETAALNGYYQAQGEYGEMLFEDWPRRRKAFQFMKNAIDQGYHTAQASWYMAKCYIYGIGTMKNQALAHDMSVAAAENGNSDAQVQLCLDYFKGNSRISKDYAECARWGEVALANGRTSVKFETAYASSSIGKKERAYELYLELAEEGNSAAMNNLGCLETDDCKAFEWYLKAAEKGSHVAQCNVAWKYRSGIGTPKDLDKALLFYHKAADNGYEEAILQLARMYRNGDCTEKNTEEAIKWYKIAVSKGRTGSLIDLASIYLFDINDTTEAIRYYKEAAEKGENSAVFEIGEIYEKGIGIERNMNTALYWYRKAASAGNVKAVEALKRLGANWIVDGKLKDATDDNDIESSPE